MKFKLLKDLPWASVGTIFIGDKEGAEESVKMWCTTEENAYFEHSFPLPTFSDWFEEVDERWKPERGQEYFVIRENLRVTSFNCANDGTDEKFYNAGNCFRTFELAASAAEQIKALLKEFHKKNP